MYAVTFHLANGADPLSVVHRIMDRGALNPTIVGNTVEAFAEEEDFPALSKFAEWAKCKDSPSIHNFTFVKNYVDYVADVPATPDSIREQFAKAKFQILVPEKLTDRQLNIVLRARQNPADPLFQRIVPLPVASFSEEACEDILKIARLQPSKMSRSEIRKAFSEDVQTLNLGFYGVPITTWSTESEIKYFREAQTPELHSDSTDVPRPAYVGRIGSFPIEAMRQRHIRRMTPEVKRHFNRAKAGDENSLDFLRTKKILTPLPLNKVMMMIAARNSEGTMHCSSYIAPGKGGPSGFLRAFGAFQKRPIAG